MMILFSKVTCLRFASISRLLPYRCHNAFLFVWIGNPTGIQSVANERVYIVCWNLPFFYEMKKCYHLFWALTQNKFTWGTKGENITETKTTSVKMSLISLLRPDLLRRLKYFATSTLGGRLDWQWRERSRPATERVGHADGVPVSK